MANFSPNMNLQLPVVGVDTGRTWELSIDSNSNIIDAHDHSPGYGVPITPLGFNINSDLSFNDYSATSIRGLLFSNPSVSSSLTFLYTAAQSGGGVFDLFFNDGAGNVIPITKAGIVNAVASSIPGESYSGGTFTWVQGAGSTTPANFDIGTITIRPNTAGTTNGVILQPPAAIASLYGLVLPLVPAALSFMTLDASGNFLTSIPFANGITASNIANGTITGTQITSSVALAGSPSAAVAIFPSGTSFAQLRATTTKMLVTLDNASANPYALVLSTIPATPLKIIRGEVNASGTKISGEGFTSSRFSAGVFVITPSIAFADVPACSATPVTQQLTPNTPTLGASSITIAFYNTAGVQTDTIFSFMLIGAI